MRGRMRLVLAGVVAMAAAGLYLATAAPAGPRSLRMFDPDRVAEQADWAEVSRLLHQSYRELHAALAKAR